GPHQGREMVGELLGGVVSLVAESFGGAIFEGLWWLVPKRVTRSGMIFSWLATPAAMWWSLDWWRVDPASTFRTGLACLCWVTLPGALLLLGLVHGDTMAERDRLRRDPGR